MESAIRGLLDTIVKLLAGGKDAKVYTLESALPSIALEGGVNTQGRDGGPPWERRCGAEGGHLPPGQKRVQGRREQRKKESVGEGEWNLGMAGKRGLPFFGLRPASRAKKGIKLLKKVKRSGGARGSAKSI